MEEGKGDQASGAQSYFDELQKSFEKMNDNLVNELQGLQSQLNKRSTDWNEHLNNLRDAGDMLYGNLGKQLEFQQKLDKVMEESQKRQADMAAYYQSKINTFSFTPKDAKKEKEKEGVTNSPTSEKSNDKVKTEPRSILDRYKRTTT